MTKPFPSGEPWSSSQTYYSSPEPSVNILSSYSTWKVSDEHYPVLFAMQSLCKFGPLFFHPLQAGSIGIYNNAKLSTATSTRLFFLFLYLLYKFVFDPYFPYRFKFGTTMLRTCGWHWWSTWLASNWIPLRPVVRSQIDPKSVVRSISTMFGVNWNLKEDRLTNEWVSFMSIWWAPCTELTICRKWSTRFLKCGRFGYDS